MFSKTLKLNGVINEKNKTMSTIIILKISEFTETMKKVISHLIHKIPKIEIELFKNTRTKTPFDEHEKIKNIKRIIDENVYNKNSAS